MMSDLKVGTIVKGRDIGRKEPSQSYILAACENCGKERWVRVIHSKPRARLCSSCQGKALGGHNKGKLGSRWQNGRYKLTDGYIYVLLSPDSQFYPMANQSGYVLEHRLVVAKRLNRCLLKSEKVHHIDGIKDHNEDSNLELISPANHILYKTMCKDCELRKEIRLLRWQVKELTQTFQERLI